MTKTNTNPSPAGGVTCDPALTDAFLAMLRDEWGLAPATRDAYARDLDGFWATVRKLGVAPREIHIGVVSHHLRALRERGLKDVSIARHLAAIRLFLRHLYSENAIDADVAMLIDSVRTESSLPTTLTEREVARLVAAPAALYRDEVRAKRRGTKNASDTSRNEARKLRYLRDRAILELLYATGMRVSEMVSLTDGQINAAVGYVRVIGKGRKERIVPIGSKALDALADYMEARSASGQTRTEAAVFLSRTNRPLDRSAIWRIIRKYARHAGLVKSTSPHTLRHCFATHLLSNSADLRVVQELLGHSNVATTQIYTHVDASRLRSVHRQYHPRQ